MRERLVEVDIDNNSPFLKNVRYKQYDNGNTLSFLIKNKDIDVNLLGYDINAYFQLPNDIVLERNVIIDENLVTMILDSTILSQAGVVALEVTFTKEGVICTTFTMYIEVEKSINRDIAIHNLNVTTSSFNDISLYEKKIKELEERIEKIEKQNRGN